MGNAGRLDSSVYRADPVEGRALFSVPEGPRDGQAQAPPPRPPGPARAAQDQAVRGAGLHAWRGRRCRRGLGWSPRPGHRYLRGYPDGRRGRTRSAGAAAMAPRPGLGRLTCWRCPIWAEPANDINRRRGEGARAPAGRRRPGSSADGRVLALRAHPPALGCRDYTPQRLRVCVHVYTRVCTVRTQVQGISA